MKYDFAVYQILIFLVAVILFLRTFVLFLRAKKSIRELFLAFVIWGNFALIGLYPNFTVIIARISGFQEGVNAIIVISLIILFYNVLVSSLKQDKMENSITRLVRQEAIEDMRKKYLKEK